MQIRCSCQVRWCALVLALCRNYDSLFQCHDLSRFAGSTRRKAEPYACARGTFFIQTYPGKSRGIYLHALMTAFWKWAAPVPD